MKIKIDQLAKVGENDRVKFDFSFFFAEREKAGFPFFYSFSVVATRGSQRCGSSSRGISLREILFVCIGARIKREELVRV